MEKNDVHVGRLLSCFQRSGRGIIKSVANAPLDFFARLLGSKHDVFCTSAVVPRTTKNALRPHLDALRWLLTGRTLRSLGPWVFASLLLVRGPQLPPMSNNRGTFERHCDGSWRTLRAVCRHTLLRRKNSSTLTQALNKVPF